MSFKAWLLLGGARSDEFLLSVAPEASISGLATSAARSAVSLWLLKQRLKSLPRFAGSAGQSALTEFLSSLRLISR